MFTLMLDPFSMFIMKMATTFHGDSRKNEQEYYSLSTIQMGQLQPSVFGSTLHFGGGSLARNIRENNTLRISRPDWVIF